MTQSRFTPGRGPGVVVLDADVEPEVAVVEGGSRARVVVGELAIEGPVEEVDRVLQAAAERLADARARNLEARLRPYEVTRLPESVRPRSRPASA